LKVQALRSMDRDHAHAHACGCAKGDLDGLT